MRFLVAWSLCVALLSLQGTAQTDKTPERAVSVDSDLSAFVPAPELSGSLSVVAAETMTGVTKQWIADFGTRQKRVAVTLQSQASMSVPSALNSGVARVAALSRELNPSEVEAFKRRHGYVPTEIAVALGSYDTPTHTVALTLYVNDANPIQRLTLQQVDAIWCTTLHRGAAAQVTHWGQLGLTGAWVNAPIHLVGVLPPDGVPNFIERRVCSNGVSRAGIQGEKNGGPTSVLTRIVQDVASDPYAIGYAGFHNRQPGTHAVQIAENSSGPYFAGTFDEVRTAVYPLTRFVYLYVDLQPSAEADDPVVRNFVEYVLSLEGQRQVLNDGTFMPLPAGTAAEQRTKLHPAR